MQVKKGTASTFLLSDISPKHPGREAETGIDTKTDWGRDRGIDTDPDRDKGQRHGHRYRQSQSQSQSQRQR